MLIATPNPNVAMALTGMPVRIVQLLSFQPTTPVSASECSKFLIIQKIIIFVSKTLTNYTKLSSSPYLFVLEGRESVRGVQAGTLLSPRSSLSSNSSKFINNFHFPGSPSNTATLLVLLVSVVAMAKSNSIV
ncbi:hypothetical protein WG66_016803 [Moniliophthora roreri]|nr:hypothetical protein WG66_016803 [Moniliophthora roreri]